MHAPHAPLPFVPQRVLVAGVTGSGKTTLARRLAAHWGLRHIEIDGLYHGPDWTPRPTFLDDVRAFAAEPRWVTEFQYISLGTDRILGPRAQLLLWLDYPAALVRRRLLRRTLMRSVLRTRLWNGNVERPPWRLLSRDPNVSILRWQTVTLHKWAERMPSIEAAYPHLTVVRLRTPAQTEAWLQAQ
jgi:adenylate kinase family enzyme